MAKTKQVRPPYQRLAERARERGYELVEPLDYLIIDKLQDEGTMMGGYYPLGESVESLIKHHFADLTPSVISSRLRVMDMQGLVMKVKMPGKSNKGTGWQRTKEGQRIVKEWKEKKS